MQWSKKMNDEEKKETQCRFDELLRKITENAAHIKDSIPDDDLMLICCLMAEIAKIALNAPPSK